VTSAGADRVLSKVWLYTTALAPRLAHSTELCRC